MTSTEKYSNASFPVSGAGRTGLPELDTALGGIFWGDNVVWVADSDEEVAPFMQSIEAATRGRAPTVHVALSTDAPVWRPPGLSVVDAQAGSTLDTPKALLQAIRAAARADAQTVLFVDPLDILVGRWGGDEAAAFFTRCCPMLLGQGAIAHWIMRGGRNGSQTLRRRVADVTQCILEIHDGSLRIAKAEGRPEGTQGTHFTYRATADGIALGRPEGATRIGSALTALRRRHRLSQRELAALAGVSASAVSQAERGTRGLALDTLLRLSARLGITIDELLHGDQVRGYRLTRRGDARLDALDRLVTLADDRTSGFHLQLVRLSPGGSAIPELQHKGPELVAVGQGLVQVVLESGSPVLRAGEALIADASGVRAWKNLGEEPALVFWMLGGPGG